MLLFYLLIYLLQFNTRYLVIIDHVYIMLYIHYKHVSIFIYEYTYIHWRCHLGLGLFFNNPYICGKTVTMEANFFYLRTLAHIGHWKLNKLQFHSVFFSSLAITVRSCYSLISTDQRFSHHCYSIYFHR